MSAHEQAVEAAARAIYDALPNFSMQWQPNTAGGYSQHRVDEPYGVDGVRVRQCNDQAPAAITAYLDSMREQGWVMVPVEPASFEWTDAMYAAFNAIQAQKSHPYPEQLRAVFVAMLETTKDAQP